MEYVLLFGFFFLFFLIYVLRCIIEDKRKAAKFIERLKADYGKKPVKNYPDGRLEALSKQYNRKKNGYFVDDITWNDLEMDRVFQRMDYTLTSTGEETLYSMLRMPTFEQAQLDKRNELISYFSQHEEDRIKLWVFFAKVGRTGKYSIYDYMDYLETLGKRSNSSHLIVLALMVASLLFCLLSPSYGIMVFVCLLAYNIVTYMKQQGKNAPFVSTFEYIIRILKLVKLLEQSNISAIESQVREMKKIRRKFDSFLRFSFLVIKQDATGSDPLSILLDYVKMAFHINLIKFNQMLEVVKERKEDLLFIMETLGYMEAALSICSFRASLPYYTRAQFDCKTLCLDADASYHPLIDNPVANSLHIKRGLLLTGSNASGKSTFLKTIAILQILAQSIDTVMAKSYKTSFYQIYSSMSLRDNLANRDSYFVVEIKALKRIVDLADQSDTPIMCFVDEVLRGTNTVERIAASSEIMLQLAQKGAFCFGATHDIELTDLLKEKYDNYHFEECIEQDDVKFHYILQKGKATSRNAIKLLHMLGYEEKIIERAEKRAQEFLASGDWSLDQ